MSESKYYDYFQTIEWFRIKSIDEKYIIYSVSDNKIKYGSVIFVKIINEKRYMYAPRGPILDYNSMNQLRAFLNELKLFAKKKGYDFFKFDPKVTHIAEDEIITEGIYVVNRNEYLKQQDSSREALLKLEGFSPEGLIKKFEKKTRYNIKKAIRHGVTVNICNELAEFDLAQFYNLYKQTSEKKGFKHKPIDYFIKLINEFGSKKIVFATAYYNGQPLAITINLKMREKFVTLYGARDDKMSHVKAFHLLDYSVMCYAIENGFKYYDFGGIYCQDGDTGSSDYGLLKYKKGFCTDGFVNYIGEIDVDFNVYRGNS